MIQSKWFWPSLIVLSALSTGLLALTNSAIGLRPLVALWFLLVCPGMAFVRLLPGKDGVVQWTLAVALSLALDALVAAILVYAHLWSPNLALVILIAASLVGVSLQIKPEQVSSAVPTKRSARILLVNGEENVSTSIRNFMQASGYEMLCVQNGDEALNIVAKVEFDLILLDVVSSGIDGWEVLQSLRERSSAPIILLTPKREDADILHGFQLGADDYMAKPFSDAKLEVYVATLLSPSRAVHASEDTVTSEELTINFERKQVMAGGQKFNLTPTEYRLLEVLARHANRTIPLSRLLTEVWGSNDAGNKQSIKHFIWSLRKKIEPEPGVPKRLITRRGYGYRFE